MTKAFQRKLLATLAVLALLSTYVAIGFAICAGFPQITRNLANEHSDFNGSPWKTMIGDLLALKEPTRRSPPKWWMPPAPPLMLAPPPLIVGTLKPARPWKRLTSHPW